MQFSIGVEYGLHCLLYLVGRPAGSTLGVKELASFQGISESYLSKVFTKLRKAGIVRATPGVKGGYELARDAKNISFWDVVVAIEGNSNLFQCAGILNNVIINDDDFQAESLDQCPCLIKEVMLEGEEKMREYLRGKSLYWLNEEVNKKIPEGRSKAIKEWFDKAKK